MSDLLQFLWEQTTDPTVQFSVNAVECWPVGMFERLQEAKLLIVGTSAKFIPCDDCDGSHVEPVEWREAVTEPKPFIRCPRYGRRQVYPDRLRQWKVHYGELATETARHLVPQVSKELLERVASGRFSEADRAEVIELLSQIPSEATLKKRRKETKSADDQRLDWTTDGMAPQLALLVRALWDSRGEVHWSELPDDAFDEGPARTPATTFEALRRLRSLLSGNYGKYFLAISVSNKKQTVTFQKDPLRYGGE